MLNSETMAWSGIRKVLAGNQFLKAVGVLSGGAVVSQLLVIGIAPLLTRLYDPRDLGLLATYAAVVSLLSVVCSLRYELAIPLARNEGDADCLTVLCFLVLTTTSIVVGTSVALMHLAGALHAFDAELAAYLWIIPVALFVSGAGAILHYRTLRATAYRSIAVSQLAQSSTTAIIQLVAYKFGSLALIGAQVCGQMVASICLGRAAAERPMRWKQSWEEIVECALRFRRYPQFSMWTSLLSVANAQVPVLLMAAGFAGTATGYFALATRVLALPMHLVGQAVTHVYFARAPVARSEGNLAELTSRVHQRLVQISLAPLVLLASISPDLFSMVFGENWRTAGEYAQVMCPWLYLSFVCGPIVRLFEVIDKQMYGTVLQMAFLLMGAGGVFVGISFSDPEIAIQLLTVANVVCWGGFLVWLGSHLKPSPAVFALATFRESPAALLCVSPVWIEMQLNHGEWQLGLVVSLMLLILRGRRILTDQARAEPGNHVE